MYKGLTVLPLILNAAVFFYFRNCNLIGYTGNTSEVLIRQKTNECGRYECIGERFDSRK